MRAEVKALRSACSASWRIFAAKGRIFIVSATVLPNISEIYSIWVGAITKTSLVILAGFNFLIGCCIFYCPPCSFYHSSIFYHIFLGFLLVYFVCCYYIIKYLDRKAQNCYIFRDKSKENGYEKYFRYVIGVCK